MAKPKRKRGDEHAVSLFPFLSILACVIGTLTLMITGLALSQMDSPAVAAALDLEQIEAELQLKQRDVEQLRNDVTASEQSAGRTHRDLQSARAQLAELAREIDRLIERNQQPVEVEVPKVDAAAHQQRMDALRKELQRLKARRDQLLADIKKLAETPPEAEVQIRPGGTGVDLAPTFVECTAEGIVMYNAAEPAHVSRADVAGNPAFIALVDRIAEQPKSTIVFLLRSDGLATYRVARRVAQQHFARNGKLPVLGKGRLDLSLFEDTP